MKLLDEYTKLIVFAVMLTYFRVIEVGVEISRIDPNQYTPLATLAGGVTGVTIAYYCWKAKNQNIEDMKLRGEIIDGGFEGDSSPTSEFTGEM